MGARPKGLAIPSVAGLEPGVAPYREGETLWGAVGATVAHAACHTSARMQGEVAGGGAAERSGTPIVGRIGAGDGPYRGGERRGARRGHCGTCHTCRPDERMQDEIAGDSGTGQAGGSGWSSDALRTACGQPLVEPSCSTKVSYEPDWASAAGADSETRVVARRRRVWTAWRQCTGLGWEMMRGRSRERDSGKKALAFSLHPFGPWMSFRVVMLMVLCDGRNERYR